MLSLIQAIYRNACNLGLKIAYENNRYNIRKIVKMLIALALLRPERSYEGFLVTMNIQYTYN